MKLNISSDDINLLVYRYLIENGYCHTAFCFNKEASINTNPFYGNHADKIPPNALVSFMQKAMIYIYLEYHTDDITGEQILCDESFSFFRKHNCFRKLGQTHGLPLSQSNFTHTEDKDQLDKSNVNNNSSAVKPEFDLTNTGFTPDDILESNSSLFQLNHPVYVGPPQRRLSDKWQLYGYHKLFEYKCSNLSTTCHFNPAYPGYVLKIVVDAPSSLYKLNDNGKASICEILLPHAKLSSNKYDPGVTTSSKWRPDGVAVCTGHSDGNVNLWSMEGHYMTSVRVEAAVTAVAFSGSRAYWNEVDAADVPYYVAVGCATGQVLVYKVDKNKFKLFKQYSHTTCVTDVEWKSPTVVSSTSMGGNLVLYDVTSDSSKELMLSSVNNVPFMEWDYYGRYLAMVDDTEIFKVYKPKENEVDGELVLLSGHKAKLIGASWYSGIFEKSSCRICTIAMDKQMIVWDVAAECLVMSLALDQMPTTVSVSPNDSLVAIGSYGNSIKMYALPNLTLVCSFYDQTVPTNVSWSADRQHLLYNVFNLQRTLIVPLNTLSSIQSD
ncbi:transducin beta-like protein 1 [Theileria orientalis strain Shintoku]|uniref:Transducin beta-like protein 1 n=1 Tax=Theileria orientalis strain Shintoku TaxID=869250 RepID=J4CCY0_THEOR|nr:transducin beta-like protein 1 [Theileria orientalis strain Shintoku]BAM40177.1 transducin beta-like protein 1 [Theileria orientalis strain Shintoku]|eukprot:XP_009690478.1 transducin beta-like protein 1 [Theileria orientalis strain Shintoku]